MKVRVNGTVDPWKTLVCTEDSQFQITNEVNKKRTNCGVDTSIADADFNASGNAVQNPIPTSLEVSYKDIKAWQLAKTLLDFQYISEADAAQGLAEGDGVNNFGSGYFTETTFNGTAEENATFSWSFEGTGTLDVFSDESGS